MGSLYDELLEETQWQQHLSYQKQAEGTALISSIERLLERLKGGSSHLDQEPPGVREKITGDNLRQYLRIINETFKSESVMICVNPDLKRYKRCDKQFMQQVNDTMVHVIERYKKLNKVALQEKYIIVLEHAPKSHVHILLQGIPNDLLHYVDIGLRRKFGITEIEYTTHPKLAIAYTLKSYYEPYRQMYPKVKYLEALLPWCIYYKL